jgi:HAD superfamily hydrolase (TIGR01549 family)
MGELTRAVLLDALGTLVELAPPWEHFGRDGDDPERVKRGFLAEMAYYRGHAIEGRDPGSVASLRESCAAILSRELGRPVEVDELMAAIVFRPFDDAAPALRALRRRGVRLVVVSNWDASLPEVLDRVGIGQDVDAVVTSAGAGAAKPDAAMFEAALKAAGCAAEEALHVGDSPTEDRDGARAAGVRAFLIDRHGGAGDISSLAEVEGHL